MDSRWRWAPPNCDRQVWWVTWAWNPLPRYHQLISEQGTDSDVDWHDVASSLENRNNKDCRKRWVYTLAPSINKGCWNQQEDALLMKGIQMHGFQFVPLWSCALNSYSSLPLLERVLLTSQPRWVFVSRVVGTRQPDRR